MFGKNRGHLKKPAAKLNVIMSRELLVCYSVFPSYFFPSFHNILSNISGQMYNRWQFIESLLLHHPELINDVNLGGSILNKKISLKHINSRIIDICILFIYCLFVFIYYLFLYLYYFLFC